jgi:flagellar biosynthesis protein FliQ
MYWPDGVNLVQSALLAAFWLALPLLAAIAAAGLVGGLLQSSLGHSDPSTLVAPKLAAAAVAYLFFGAWMLSFTCNYWIRLWQGLGALIR